MLEKKKKEKDSHLLFQRNPTTCVCDILILMHVSCRADNLVKVTQMV